MQAASKGGKAKPAPPEKPRREDIEFYKIDPMMPPPPDGFYLIEYLFEFGPVKKGGSQELESGDLVHWEHLLGIEWKPYESRLLLRMSKAYFGEMNSATKRDAPPPWGIFAKPWKWVQQQKGERRLNAFLR